MSNPWGKRDMNLLDWVQRRAIKMMKGLEHLACEESLRELDFSAWRRIGLMNPIHLYIYLRQVKKMEPDSFQWHPGTVQEAKSTDWNTGKNLKPTFLLYTEHWHSLPRMVYGVSILGGIQNLTACGCALSNGAGLDDLLDGSSLHHSVILWL